MTEKLTAIKVEMGYKPNGHIKYPDFNLVDLTKRNGMNWSHFVDKYGVGGWHYDKVCGHEEVDQISPVRGIWLGMLLVPTPFALEADQLFSEVTILTEAEAEEFYNNRSHIKDETEILDTLILQGIVARVALEKDETVTTIVATPELQALRAKCLDPDEQNHRGIRHNLRKTWAEFKVLTGVEIEKAGK